MEDSVVSWLILSALTYMGLFSLVKKGIREKEEREAENHHGG